MIDRAEVTYRHLFPTEAVKAEAFDKIAELFYNCNFGSTSKADIETLMFSIFIERILKEDGPENFKSYSDYTLSKELCITQARVSNLKVRKELVYPYEDFSWKKSFQIVSKKATFENGRIKIYIPGKNLFLEIKNAIEEAGGFVEIQLTSNLLQVNLSNFLDLILAIDDETSRSELKKRIIKKIQNSKRDIQCMESEPFGKALLKQSPELIISLIGDCIPIFGGIAKTIASNLYTEIGRAHV